jgi:hypothetical protein
LSKKPLRVNDNSLPYSFDDCTSHAKIIFMKLQHFSSKLSAAVANFVGIWTISMPPERFA